MTDSIGIKLFESSQIKPELAAQIAQAAFDEFGQVEIVRAYKWSDPNWTLALFENAQLASFVNIIEREASFDEVKLKAAGINNLITLSSFRKKGYASKLLLEAETYAFNELQSEIMLLLCSDELKSFYEKHDWMKLNGNLYFEQPKQKVLWTANAMLKYKNERSQIFSNVDLCGLPW